jgi:nitroreductase/dihydropteridine reductase
MTETINHLNWRYATKRYDTEKRLSETELNIITEALRLSPSSFGLQAWKFIHVKDMDMRKKIQAAAWNQPQIVEASDFFILSAFRSIDKEFIDRFIAATAAARKVTPESLKDYRDSIVGSVRGKGDGLGEWLARQVYIALGVALAAAAENGIDASPMEGFDSKQVDELLDLPAQNLRSLVMFAVGHRSPLDPFQHFPKVRFPATEVFIER